MNKQSLKNLAELFSTTYAIVFGIALVLHVLILLVISYVKMEFLVVSGLNIVDSSAYFRAFLLIPYLFTPLVIAGIRVWRKLQDELSK